MVELNTILAIIFFVAAVILAVVLAFKFAKKRQPVWAYRTTKRIGLGSNTPPELKLTFDEQTVSDLYQTTVVVFNRGNEAILKGNVTESIVIHFGGASILREPTVLAKSREGIGLLAKRVVDDGGDAIEVTFDYLDHNDGAVIEVWHTKRQDISISGNVIGTSGIRHFGEFAPVVEGRWLTEMLSIAVLTPIFLVVFLVLTLREGSLNRLEYIVMVAFLAVVSVVSWVPILRTRRFPRWSVIKD